MTYKSEISRISNIGNTFNLLKQLFNRSRYTTQK